MTGKCLPLEEQAHQVTKLSALYFFSKSLQRLKKSITDSYCTILSHSLFILEIQLDSVNTDFVDFFVALGTRPLEIHLEKNIEIVSIKLKE